MDPVSIGAFLLKNWKVFVAIGFFAGMVGLGVYVKILRDDKDKLALTITQKDLIITQNNKDIASLNAGLTAKTKEMAGFVDTLNTIAASKNKVEIVYRDVVNAIESDPPPEITLAKPVTLIPAGTSAFDRYTTDSKVGTK